MYFLCERVQPTPEGIGGTDLRRAVDVDVYLPSSAVLIEHVRFELILHVTYLYIAVLGEKNSRHRCVSTHGFHVDRIKC